MSQSEESALNQPIKKRRGLKNLEFITLATTDAAYALYEAKYVAKDKQNFVIEARHLVSDGDAEAIQAVLSSMYVRFKVKPIDAAKEETPEAEAAQEVPDAQVAKKAGAQPVLIDKTNLIFEIKLADADIPQGAYQVDFKIDPSLSISQMGTSTHTYYFGYGNAISINLRVKAENVPAAPGTIDASVSPNPSTPDPQHVGNNQTRRLIASCTPGTTFTVNLTGAGTYTLTGTYNT